MNIFEDDLLKNKYFLIIVGILAVIVLLLYLKDSNSLENQCKRRIEKVGIYFSPGNKLQEGILGEAMRQQIEECVKSGNK